MRIKAQYAWSPGWGKLRGPVVIDVQDGRIQDVADAGPGSDEADFETDLTAVPGLIDCHDHIGIDVGDERAQAADAMGKMLLRGAARLQTMIRGGVTTIRDCGERTDVEPFWMQALEQGTIVGPRVVRSVTPISRTGGHAWYLSLQADGPDDLRAAVRRNVRDGADFIKAMVTGGLGTLGSVALAPEFSAGELQALIEEAHRLGRKVAGHAYGGDGVDSALAAGIDSIEHGALLADSQLERMAEQRTFLVLTTAVIADSAQDPFVPESIRSLMAGVVDEYHKTIRRALAQGVRIAMGCDGIHGRIDREIVQLVELGASPEQALRAATGEAADLIGRPDTGRLEPGSHADVLFVAGDPLADPTVLAEPMGVLGAGKWVRALGDGA
jgi:imidazolonepropionase-like amidohydrolase